jgi:hypothetical protein
MAKFVTGSHVFVLVLLVMIILATNIEAASGDAKPGKESNINGYNSQLLGQEFDRQAISFTFIPWTPLVK